MRITKAIALAVVLAASAFAQKPAFAIVEKIAGEVGFYTADGKRISGVKVGTHPHEIILSPDKKHLYVTDNGILWMTNPGEGGNTISVIDVEKRQKAGVIDLGNYRRPHGIDIDPKTGRIAVTIENPDGMLLIDPVKRTVLRKFDVQGEDPHMVAFGPGGQYAYVSNTGSGTVAAVHVASGKVKLIKTDAGPQGGVFTRDGKLLYLTNAQGGSISIIDTSKNEEVGKIKISAGAARIALTPDEKTLVYNTGEGNSVAFADVASRKELAVIPLGGRPLSLTVSPDVKTAYAGIQDQDKVIVISVPDRKIVRSFSTPKGAGPDPVLPLP
jgi:DNA-binding beta-propeller fold protein YncE